MSPDLGGLLMLAPTDHQFWTWMMKYCLQMDLASLWFRSLGSEPVISQGLLHYAINSLFYLFCVHNAQCSGGYALSIAKKETELKF